jgi:hypothetical protein
VSGNYGFQRKISGGGGGGGGSGVVIHLFISNCKWVSAWWQWYYNKTTHKYMTHKITHHPQEKDSIQSYTNNEGHITANEYRAEKGRIQLSLL